MYQIKEILNDLLNDNIAFRDFKSFGVDIDQCRFMV